MSTHDAATQSERSAGAQMVADVLLAVAVAVVLGALSASGVGAATRHSPWLPVAVAAYAVVHISVAFRVRFPIAAYAAAAVAMAVVAAVPDLPVDSAGRVIRVTALLLPSSLAFLIVLFSVAAHTPIRPSVAALAVALVGAVWSGVRVGRSLSGDGLGDWLVGAYLVIGLLVVATATWGLGRLAAERRRRRIADRERLRADAVRAERERIAREMHDVVAHSLAVIVRQAEGGAFVAPRDPAAAAAALETVARTGRTALTDMRGLLGVLREPNDMSTDDRPQPGVDDLDDLLDRVRHAGLTVHRHDTGELADVAPGVGLAIYRTVQEALTNTLKHAGPGARADVSLDWTAGEVTATIVDVARTPDGDAAPAPEDVGASAPDDAGAAPVPGAGVGLAGLRSRVDAVGGMVEIGPTADGFRVCVRLPVTREA